MTHEQTSDPYLIGIVAFANTQDALCCWQEARPVVSFYLFLEEVHGYSLLL